MHDVDDEPTTYHHYSFRDLRMRFEAPNEQNRWDYPLFKVAAIDEGKQAVVESQ